MVIPWRTLPTANCIPDIHLTPLVLASVLGTALEAPIHKLEAYELVILEVTSSTISARCTRRARTTHERLFPGFRLVMSYREPELQGDVNKR